jgi:hypothetical protein
MQSPAETHDLRHAPLAGSQVYGLQSVAVALAPASAGAAEFWEVWGPEQVACRGTHCALSQPYPAAQSESFWQVVLQRSPAPSQARFPAQDCGVPATQWP